MSVRTVAISPTLIALFLLPCCAHVEHEQNNGGGVERDVEWDIWSERYEDEQFEIFEIGVPDYYSPSIMICRCDTGAYQYTILSSSTSIGSKVAPTLDELVLALARLRHLDGAVVRGIRVRKGDLTTEDFNEIQESVARFLDRIPHEPELLEIETVWRFDHHGLYR